MSILASIPVVYYKMYQSTSENCWLKRTPLETALILLLIVAIPFLVVIIIVYMVSIFQRYPDYSRLCANFCSSKQSQVFNIESVNPDVFNDNHKKYHICPEKIFEKIKDSDNFKYIASVLEDVYIDDFIEQRFLCTAVIVNMGWVITSAKCIASRNQMVKNNLYVRAGSEYWSSDGVVRKIRNIVPHHNIITAIELISSFSSTPSIQPIGFSKKSLFKHYGVAEMYFWPNNDSAPLTRRQKYTSLQVHPAVILTSNECSFSSKSNVDTYCITSMLAKFPCEYYVGFVLIQRKKLMGVDIDSYCDLRQKATMFHVYDVSALLNWLKQTVISINITA